MELRFGLIRAIAPKYAKYKYAKLDSFEQSTADNTNVTKALKQLGKTAVKWTQIDVDQVARKAGVDRALVIRKLQEWNDSGAIDLQPSGIVNRFRVLKSFPQGVKEHKEIFAEMHAYFEKSEKDAMARIQDVIGLMTAKACISRGLAKHFGDEGSVGLEGCGHCSFCINKTSVPFDQSNRQSRKGRITAAKVIAVLAAIEARDDPRFLARIAFGVSSPRVAREKLSKNKVFGSMDDCDFDVGSVSYVHSAQLIWCSRSWSTVSGKPVMVRLVAKQELTYTRTPYLDGNSRGYLNDMALTPSRDCDWLLHEHTMARLALCEPAILVDVIFNIQPPNHPL